MKTWLIVITVLVIIVQSIINTNAALSKMPLSELDRSIDQDNDEDEDNNIAKEKIIQTLRTKKSTSSKKVTQKVRAPQYMWDLYNSLADKATGRIKGGASNFLIKHNDRKFQCDLIQGIRSMEGGNVPIRCCQYLTRIKLFNDISHAFI